MRTFSLSNASLVIVFVLRDLVARRKTLPRGRHFLSVLAKAVVLHSIFSVAAVEHGQTTGNAPHGSVQLRSTEHEFKPSDRLASRWALRIDLEVRK